MITWPLESARPPRPAAVARPGLHMLSPEDRLYRADSWRLPTHILDAGSDRGVLTHKASVATRGSTEWTRPELEDLLTLCHALNTECVRS